MIIKKYICKREYIYIYIYKMFQFSISYIYILSFFASLFLNHTCTVYNNTVSYLAIYIYS